MNLLIYVVVVTYSIQGQIFVKPSPEQIINEVYLN
jgi:hypothetical protein